MSNAYRQHRCGKCIQFECQTWALRCLTKAIRNFIYGRNTRASANLNKSDRYRFLEHMSLRAKTKFQQGMCNIPTKRKMRNVQSKWNQGKVGIKHKGCTLLKMCKILSSVQRIECKHAVTAFGRHWFSGVTQEMIRLGFTYISTTLPSGSHMTVAIVLHAVSR